MAIKELRKTWSDCQLDYVREFIATKESDVDKLPTCCVGSTCVVSETNNRYVCGKGNQWKLREKAMEEGDAVVKSINGVLPDENGELTTCQVKPISFMDGTAFGLPTPQYYGLDSMAEIVDWLRSQTSHEVVFYRVIALPGNKAITRYDTGHEMIRLGDGAYNARIFFGDDLCPIILDSVNNKMIFDPDWVKPTSGGGIKTAIFKQGGLDGLLAGETVDYTTSLFCKNMTRDEAIQTIMSGEPLDVIYITYEGAEDSISSIGVRRINDCINYNILKDRLYVDNGAIWMEDGELAWPAE